MHALQPRAPHRAAPTLATRRRSDDPSLDGALYTARVNDTRPLSGESAASPRVVAALPFQDKADTSGFADDYSCQAQVWEGPCGWRAGPGWHASW